MMEDDLSLKAEGIHKCYFAEFKRLDKLFVENSTLPLAAGELIGDIFRYCVNINDNLLGHRGIEISNIDSTTSRIDTDVVMQESVLPGVSETLGISSLVDLILTRTEKQMDTSKPIATKIMQEFQDFDNDRFNVSKYLFDIVQNSKLRFMTCKEVFLLDLTSQIHLVLPIGPLDLSTAILHFLYQKLLRNYKRFC